MTRARTITKLPLYRWAEIIGISPVHFSGGYVEDIWDYPDHACDDIWTQYSWQRPEVASREHIAELIHTSTQDIENILGYPVKATYVAETVPVPVTQGYRYFPPQFETRWNKLIQFGQYTQTEVDAEVNVVLSDTDNDGFKETATIIFPYSGDTHELRFYNVGKTDDRYRLYPHTISQASGVVTVIFNSWELIKIALWEKPPANFDAIDLELDSNFETVVSVYRKYIDPTKVQANLVWKSGDSYGYGGCSCGGTGCTVCGVTKQPACVNILDAERGMVSLLPATYNEETESYTQTTPTIKRAPTEIELFYTAGAVNPDYVSYQSLIEMPLYLEEALTWLSAARLRFPVCACGGSKQTVDDLMTNLVEVKKERQTYLAILSPEMLTNPFGTRYGEVKAWDRISRIIQDSSFGGGIL